MSKRPKQKYLSKKGEKKHIQYVKRRDRERKRRAGFKAYLELLRKQSELKGIPLNLPEYQRIRHLNLLGEKPKHNDWITYLIPRHELFSEKKLPSAEDGLLEIPEIFSLSENYDASMFFLKRLFNVLHKQNTETIIIDYKHCTYLDVDASACMDIILGGFIDNFNKCQARGHNVRIKIIKPINYESPEVKKVLFSIGAYRNLKGFKINYEDVVAFDLRFGDKQSSNRGKIKEIHETEIVDYVLVCLEKMGHSLTAESETHLSKVIGEVIANSEEHSNFRYRFAIGYFQKTKDEDKHLGVFKLVILNFGQTIYESFSRSDCPNVEAVNQMKHLSEHFTTRGLFTKAEYEEQTLWTLYALQEGVTSTKDWKRGNGSIRFIDRFFKLKGDSTKDDKSKLTLISGNTRIIFDGTHPLIDVKKGKNNRNYKMMTFNPTGNIHEKPDKKYVTFAPEFFPGTIISAKICISHKNIEPIS